MTKNYISIVFAINEKFKVPFAATLKSLLDSNPHEVLSVYLLYDTLDESDFEKIKEIFSGQNGSLEFVKLNSEVFDNLPTPFHLPLAAYYRLLIPLLISSDKVLYLDSDLLIKSSIRPLWDLDLEDNYVAATLEFTRNWHPDLPFNKEVGYVNSGVLLINSALWRKENFAEKVLTFARNFPKLIQFADQCAINACIEGKVKLLSPEWNLQAFIYERRFKKLDVWTDEQVKLAKKNPKIIHFSGSLKPWHWGCKHPNRFQYWRTLYGTPYRAHTYLIISLWQTF
jgi:lipopolysaccharide biosynthesis glycosyltransferase